MHFIVLVLLMVGMLLKTLLPGDLINFVIDRIPKDLIETISKYDDTVVSETVAEEEIDFSRDEDGNLVLILPEGYSVGGLEGDD